MTYSPRPPRNGAPRPNHIIHLASRDLAWAATDLDRVSKALAGREFLIAADIAEAQQRIVSVHATIAKVSAELTSPASGLLVRGASNEFPAVEGGVRS